MVSLAFHVGFAPKPSLAPERLERWFIHRDDTYQVVQDIRDMIVFAEHNLIRDASFTHLNLLCCRNVQE